MGRRYNDPSYVEEWQLHRSYPRIHNNCFNQAGSTLSGTNVLDLCSSTGLLGRRMVDELGLQVVAIERDQEAVELGKKAGVYDGIPLLEIQIDRSSLSALGAWIEAHHVRAVVARRCLCTLSRAIPLPALAATFAEAGVDEVLLEGQRIDSRAKHPLGHADAQAHALEPIYATKASFKDVRYLLKK